MPTLLFDIETVSQADNSEATLSPVTATLGTLTVYDVERERGVVYVVHKESNPISLDESWQVKLMSEPDVLQEFWKGTEEYDTYVGFGTRRFDIPFLIHRAVAEQITVHKRFTNKRYLADQTFPYHIDLQDEFSFYGTMSKPLSLQQLFMLYKIYSVDQVFTGTAINQLFIPERQSDLITHCVQKMAGTANLYNIWKKYLAPTQFLNTMELI